MTDGPPRAANNFDAAERPSKSQRDGDARVEALVDRLPENSPRQRRPSQGTSPRGAEDDIGTLVAEVTPPADGSGDAVISLFSGKNDADTGTGAATDRNVERDSDGARFGPGSEFAVPAAGAINGESGSVSFWVRPDESADESSRASLLQLRSHYVFENRLQLWQTGAGLNLVLANDAGQETGIVVKSGGWEPGEWRHISVVWGDNQSEVYVNGTLAGTTEYEGKLQILPDTLLHVGSNYPEDPGGITGTVNRFNVYDRAITPEEVAGLASQLPR